ncbi:hypothetical protein A2V82_04155 [candidate division KSB1 bacterium RBG_16_48_16]|nr:MAG: hypothetical protein A2V82_04155 [candidate division KSB1 bacterium RBG_16_48_16]
MARRAKIFLFLLFFFPHLFIHCKGQSIRPFSFVSHDIRISIQAGNPSLVIAMDSLEINYSKETREIYFFLAESLAVQKVMVGNQSLPCRRERKTKYQRYLADQNSQFTQPQSPARLYKITLPPKLLPNTLVIYYQGRINFATHGDTSGHANRNSLRIEEHALWYPTVPGCLSSFRLTSISPKAYKIVSAGKRTLQIESGDSLVCIWQQDMPVRGSFLYAEVRQDRDEE